MPHSTLPPDMQPDDVQVAKWLDDGGRDLPNADDEPVAPPTHVTGDLSHA